MPLCVATVFVLRPEALEAITLAAVLSASLLFQATEALALPFHAELRSSVPVRIRVRVFVTFALIKLVLILRDASLETFVLVTVLESMSVGMALIIAYRLDEGHHSFGLDARYAVGLLGRSWPLLVASISGMVYLRADLIMIAEMVGDEQAGIYAAATKLSEAWYFVPMALVASVQPALVAERQRDETVYLKRLRQLYAIMAAGAVGAAVLVTFVSSSVVLVIYGETYSEAASVLVVHVWGAVPVFLGVASTQYLVVENLQRYSAYRTAIGMVVNLLLNLWLIPIWGAVGAAVATVISYMVAVFSLCLFRPVRAQALMMIQALSPMEWVMAFHAVRGARSGR